MINTMTNDDQHNDVHKVQRGIQRGGENLAATRLYRIADLDKRLVHRTALIKELRELRF